MIFCYGVVYAVGIGFREVKGEDFVGGGVVGLSVFYVNILS